MTPQERKVLEMALEALELMYACYKNPKWVSYKQQEQKILEQTVDTITAIKEALAQPEQDEKFCDNNCVWTDHHPDCRYGEPNRHELQAKGEHPAPCARFCEANAFQIEIRSLKKQLEEAQNGWCKALEKLQTHQTEQKKLAYYEKVADDLQALCDKQSLRIAELEAQPEQEPVAWADHGVVNWIVDKQFKHASYLYEGSPPALCKACVYCGQLGIKE